MKAQPMRRQRRHRKQRERPNSGPQALTWTAGRIVVYSRSNSDETLVARVVELCPNDMARIQDDATGEIYTVCRHSTQLRAPTLHELEKWRRQARQPDVVTTTAAPSTATSAAPAPKHPQPATAPTAMPRRCTSCAVLLPTKSPSAQTQCYKCEWEQALPQNKRERRAELVLLREQAGAAIPEMSRGTPLARAMALDVATEIITRMPAWLWLVVREEMAQAGIDGDLTDPAFWKYHQQFGFYGFLAIVLIYCLTQRKPDQPVPVRLLAIIIYAGTPGSAGSGVLDALLARYPLTEEDAKPLHVLLPKLPLQKFGAFAAAGLAQLDPLGRATGWLASTTPETADSATSDSQPSPADRHQPSRHLPQIAMNVLRRIGRFLLRLGRFRRDRPPRQEPEQ